MPLLILRFWGLIQSTVATIIFLESPLKRAEYRIEQNKY